MIVVGDSRSSHVKKWHLSLENTQASRPIELLSDFVEAEKVGNNKSFIRSVVDYISLVVKVCKRVVLTNRSFHIHYVSRYSIVSLLVPSARLYCYVYGSDITEAPYRSRLLKSLIGYNLRRCECAVVSSPFLEKKVRQFESHTSIEVVPFGINQSFLELSTSESKTSNSLRLGCFKYCRVETYGLDQLISIFEWVVKKHDQHAQLFLIEDGPDLSELQKLILTKGVENNVVFLPSVDTQVLMASYIARVDITVYPSRIESFGVSLLESMALGVPSFVSRVGGMRGIVSDEENGCFLAESHEKSADMIFALFSDKHRYADMAKASKDTIKRSYIWEDAFQRFYNQYLA